MNAAAIPADLAELLGDVPAATEVGVKSNLLTEAEFGRLIGVSARRVRQLFDDGVIAKAAPARYAIAEVTKYCAWMRQQASRGVVVNDDHKAARTRLAQEQADKAALANAITRGEMIPAAEVEREWSNVLRGVQATMLAVPSRVRSRLPALSADEAAVIDREVRDALAEAAEVVE